MFENQVRFKPNSAPVVPSLHIVTDSSNEILSNFKNHNYLSQEPIILKIILSTYKNKVASTKPFHHLRLRTVI